MWVKPPFHLGHNAALKAPLFHYTALRPLLNDLYIEGLRCRLSILMCILARIMERAGILDCGCFLRFAQRTILAQGHDIGDGR